MSGHRDDGTFAEDKAHHPNRKVSKGLTFEFVDFADLPASKQASIKERDKRERKASMKAHDRKQKRKDAREARFEENLEIED